MRSFSLIVDLTVSIGFICERVSVIVIVVVICVTRVMRRVSCD
jgi:hypothetical protein